MLDDEEVSVRKAALTVLGALSPPALIMHAGSIAEKLDDPHPSVREKAGAVSHVLAGAVAMRLEDKSPSARWAAISRLGRLQPAALEEHRHAISRCAADKDASVRHAT